MAGHEIDEEDDDFHLYSQTTLYGLLSHFQAVSRKLASLMFMAALHPAARPEKAAMVLGSKDLKKIQQNYQKLKADIEELFYGEVRLRDFNELPFKGTFYRGARPAGRDPFRTNMLKLKKMADRHRERKNPNLALLKDWEPKDSPSAVAKKEFPGWYNHYFSRRCR